MNKLRQRFLDEVSDPNRQEAFRMMAVAVKLPKGAIETIVNYEDLPTKVQYYITAYDDEFLLKTNTSIEIVGFMLV